MPLHAGRTSINQSTFTINNLSPDDSSFYECVPATNIMGTKKTRINVAVQVRRLAFENSVIVGNNRNHLTSLSSWLKPVRKSINSLWKRCWRASVDGWAASILHSRCDGKGPTVTIIRVGRYIFGGYTSKSWGKTSKPWIFLKLMLFMIVHIKLFVFMLIFILKLCSCVYDNVNNLFSIQYIFFLSFFLLASLSGRYQYDSKAFIFTGEQTRMGAC
ncbi:unnamed protein product [Porites lobata]|uniref:TLDc domain-containing protein n=1 Tax=Porites lobata TaxID=104759 RepID=A0ABN8QKD1_9CNID|nr:unnamed protein product [Porites lobata]